MLVVVRTPPKMLRVFGAKRYVCPVVLLVTITSRMFPGLSVMIRLTVPKVVPPLVCTGILVVRPGSAVGATAPRASELFVFARLIACGLACCRLWLLVARVVGVVVVS